MVPVAEGPVGRPLGSCADCLFGQVGQALSPAPGGVGPAWLASDWREPVTKGAQMATGNGCRIGRAAAAERISGLCGLAVHPHRVPDLLPQPRRRDLQPAGRVLA